LPNTSKTNEIFNKKSLENDVDAVEAMKDYIADWLAYEQIVPIMKQISDINS